MYKTLNVMGYDVFVDDISSIKIDENRKQIINTINPHSYITAKKDTAFKEALHSSNTLLPDGIGVVLAAKYTNNEEIQKITGSDLHVYLLEELNNTGGSVFFVGASQGTLDKISEKVTEEFPFVKVNSHSPPFKSIFSEEENTEIISQVNAFNPDVLFVGMTAPKQEKWLNKHKDKLNFKIASSVGAVFDFYAGTTIRPSQFWLDLRLEWLLRLSKEPKRLWKRNFISSPLFLFDLFLYKFGWKK